MHDKPVNIEKVDAWIRQVLWEKTIPGDDVKDRNMEVLRMKGMVWVDGSDRKIVLQGVRELYDKQDGGVWKDGEEKWSRMVFIGKNLDRQAMSKSFELNCL